MTLDDAVEHCLKVAKSSCGECAENHKQLAEWLTKLKELEQTPHGAGGPGMSGHTPGPWEVEKNGYHWTVRAPLEICGHMGTFELCRLSSGNDPKQEADARLIATAPEMEDLLWAAWQELSFTSQHPYQTTEQDAKWEAELAKEIYALLRRMMSNHTPGPWEARIEGEEETE